jgi:mRNA-degrading endonuclease RelE of RelBE toxin-antitoxin system
MYNLIYRKEVIKSLKKIKRSNSKTFVKEFLDIFTQIAKEPAKGEVYVGNLSGFFKFKYGKSPQYRIIYKVYSIDEIKSNPEEFEDIDIKSLENCEGIIDLIFLRTREECTSLYAQPKSYFKTKERFKSNY